MAVQPIRAACSAQAFSFSKAPGARRGCGKRQSIRQQKSSGEEGWRFNVWAPGATAVEICGGFDGWGPGVPMEKADTGLWSGFIAGLAEGDLYKYRVHGADGSVVLHSDPYAFSTELRPGTASRLARLDFRFDDSAWMERRDKCRNLPLNIYELHAGSWKQKPNATKPDGSDGWYDTRSWPGS